MSSAPPPVIVDFVSVEAVYDLRRRVLRDGGPEAASGATVRFPEDDDPGAFHLAVRPAPGATIVGVASYVPKPTPLRPARRAARLRGMAVEPSQQRHGFGRLLVEAGVDHLRAEGLEVLWANARDTALGFYERLGFDVVGEAFLAVGLPHHQVVLDLDQVRPHRTARLDEDGDAGA